MVDLLWLVPLFPLCGFLILYATAGNMPRRLVSIIGAGSVGLSALVTAGILDAFVFGSDMTPVTVTLYTWIDVAGFNPAIAFYLDGLSMTMMCVVTGVGFLIHFYAMGYMADDKDYSRFFCYLNLFVCAMLLLVMGDNLLLLFMGWEGVGLCSYLLIGFWYEDPYNGGCARKAFVVTRVGDTFMSLGMFLLFMNFGTLQIQPLMAATAGAWTVGTPTIACLLLLGGAVGKSAQLPLQTWLPDAMAGPTPVSALIHAATMVTAGVYLVARCHPLYLLSSTGQLAVALVGLITLLMAAFTALTQTDIKRILAFSTISQIGYMFLGLGVGAWASGIFHLMTHAFFKALLFMAAGSVILSLHHEQDIFKMGGLRKKLPIAYWSFMIGSAALAGFPFITSGFWSKDAILMAAFGHGDAGPWLWAGGAFGALLTAIYSFRLVFVVFYGEPRTEPHQGSGWRMGIPLVILCVLALIGGLFHVPVDQVFPEVMEEHHAGFAYYTTMAIPLIGIGIAYLIWLRRSLNVEWLTESSLGQMLRRFWFSHWAMDWLYDLIVVNPFRTIARVNKNDIVDAIYNGTASLARGTHGALSTTQTGELRRYAAIMASGAVVLIAIVVSQM